MAVNTLRVVVGSRVVIWDTRGSERERYTIVEPSEADAMASRVSSTSPLGRAVLGLAVEEQAEVRVRDGVRTVRVLAIEPPEGQ